MIRFANKFDIDEIIKLLRDFAIKSDNILTNNPQKWSESYVRAVIAFILAGKGFILIDENKTSILVAIKSECFWIQNEWQLQEVMLHSASKKIAAKLVREYIRIAKDMLNKGKITQAVLASHLDADYSNSGLQKFELHWELK